MRIPLIILLLSAVCVCSYAAEKKTKPPVAAPAPQSTPEAAPIVESEMAKEWKGLESQRQWVARLTKQIEGEKNQFYEMQKTFAEKYKLDVKKIQAGAYELDENSGKILEKR